MKKIKKVLAFLLLCLLVLNSIGLALADGVAMSNDTPAEVAEQVEFEPEVTENEGVADESSDSSDAETVEDTPEYTDGGAAGTIPMTETDDKAATQPVQNEAEETNAGNADENTEAEETPAVEDETAEETETETDENIEEDDVDAEEVNTEEAAEQDEEETETVDAVEDETDSIENATEQDEGTEAGIMAVSTLVFLDEEQLAVTEANTDGNQAMPTVSVTTTTVETENTGAVAMVATLSLELPARTMALEGATFNITVVEIKDSADFLEEVNNADANTVYKLATGVSELIISEEVAFAKDTTFNLVLDSNQKITLSASFIIEGTLNLSGGGTVQRGAGSNTDLMTVKAGGTLDITNTTLDGGAIWSETDSAVKAKALGRHDVNKGLSQVGALVNVDGGILNLNAGATLQNNESTPTVNVDRQTGGAVSVGAGGVLNMYEGSTIQNNGLRNNANYGGGVYVAGGGTANVKGGTISGNSAANGGGIYAGEKGIGGGTVNISGNTEIKNNFAGTSGGGITLMWGSKVTLDGDGVQILENVAYNKNGAGIGGGIYLSGSGEGGDFESILTINGAKIANNKCLVGKLSYYSNGSGGGIYAGGLGKLVMNSGEISGNIADEGGGIYFDTRSGGHGGSEQRTDIYHYINGKISNNTANFNGGGLHIENDYVQLGKNGEITGNKAAEEGGGVHIPEVMNQGYPAGHLIMEAGARIHGNEAGYAGADIAIKRDSRGSITLVDANEMGIDGIGGWYMDEAYNRYKWTGDISSAENNITGEQVVLVIKGGIYLVAGTDGTVNPGPGDGPDPVDPIEPPVDPVEPPVEPVDIIAELPLPEFLSARTGSLYTIADMNVPLAAGETLNAGECFD